MTDLDEKLSILLDDEAGSDTDAAIDEAIGDVNLQYRLRRYRMIGEAMRHELPHSIDTDFHNAVMARVRAEQSPVEKSAPVTAETPAPAPLFGWSWLKPVSGLALAAGVAVVTVALWQPPQEGGDTNIASADQVRIESLSENNRTLAVPVSTNLQSLGMRWKVERDNPRLQQKLNGYLVNHTEYSNSMQGLIPQARVAGFDNRQQ